MHLLAHLYVPDDFLTSPSNLQMGWALGAILYEINEYPWALEEPHHQQGTPGLGGGEDGSGPGAFGWWPLLLATLGGESVFAWLCLCLRLWCCLRVCDAVAFLRCHCSSAAMHASRGI